MFPLLPCHDGLKIVKLKLCSGERRQCNGTLNGHIQILLDPVQRAADRWYSTGVVCRNKLVVYSTTDIFMIKYMSRDTTLFRKRNVVVLIVTVIIVSVAVSTSTTQYIHYAGALTRSNITTGMMGGNKLNMSIGASGPNITGSVSLAPLIAKAIASRVNVSLVNAATIAEKASVLTRTLCQSDLQ